VPFGANLAIHHGATEAVGFARTRKASPLQLLFVGVDWVRKGASKAIEVVKQVRAMGLQAELTIVGCQPPAESTIPHYVKIRGFISKSTEEGRNELLQLYRESHFLVVPTTAEAYGLVFAEASAFGVPSISHRVGGVTTVVQDELNGRLFEMQAPVQAWAEWIVETVSRSGRLEELAATSFDEYQSRLNWKVAGRRVATLLSDRCRLHTGTQGVIVSG
jgi:glycosyltransferase involved in cell wall biosynthesis